MSQDLLCLDCTARWLARIDQVLAVADEAFARLIELSPAQRCRLSILGDKSAAFRRQALIVLLPNRQMILPELELAHACPVAGALRKRPASAPASLETEEGRLNPRLHP